MQTTPKENESLVGAAPDGDELVNQHSSYDPSFFEPLFKAENEHFWFRARNRVIAATLRRLVAKRPPGYRVIEIGCGTGNVLSMIERVCKRGLVVGMDLFGDGLRLARRRVKCPLVQGDVLRPPFDVPFDVICLFDVIEHIEEDEKVLTGVRELLADNGALFITVPAHRSLWSYFDEASHHCRRYSEAELRQKLEATGYRVDYITQYMSLIYPILWLGRRAAALKRRLAGGKNAGETGTAEHEENVQQMALDELKIVPGVNQILDFLLRFETRAVARKRKLYIGTSFLVVAYKNH